MILPTTGCRKSPVPVTIYHLAYDLLYKQWTSLYYSTAQHCNLGQYPGATLRVAQTVRQQSTMPISPQRFVAAAALARGPHGMPGETPRGRSVDILGDSQCSTTSWPTGGEERSAHVSWLHEVLCTPIGVTGALSQRRANGRAPHSTSRRAMVFGEKGFALAVAK